MGQEEKTGIGYGKRTLLSKQKAMRWEMPGGDELKLYH